MVQFQLKKSKQKKKNMTDKIIESKKYKKHNNNQEIGNNGKGK